MKVNRRWLAIGPLIVAAAMAVVTASAGGASTKAVSGSITVWVDAVRLPAAKAYVKAHYGDPSTELMTFDFDFIQWLMGPPGRLSASAARDSHGAPGEISALLAYPEGRHATVIASGLMPPGSPFSVGFRALFERACFDLE